MFVIQRETWGAVGTVPIDSTTKRELGVHHTVGPSTAGWTAAQEREHMRQLERQHMRRERRRMMRRHPLRYLRHVLTRQGWSTVGYSWVVFHSGRIYEGRGKRGLPAAQGGENSGSWAAAFVGDFDGSRDPSVEARRTVRELIVSLKDDDGLRRLGGHQEFPNQATACPGDQLMPYVRKWRHDFDLGAPR